MKPQQFTLDQPKLNRLKGVHSATDLQKKHVIRVPQNSTIYSIVQLQSNDAVTASQTVYPESLISQHMNMDVKQIVSRNTQIARSLKKLRPLDIVLVQSARQRPVVQTLSNAPKIQVYRQKLNDISTNRFQKTQSYLCFTDIIKSIQGDSTFVLVQIKQCKFFNKYNLTNDKIPGLFMWEVIYDKKSLLRTVPKEWNLAQQDLLDFIFVKSGSEYEVKLWKIKNNDEVTNLLNQKYVGQFNLGITDFRGMNLVLDYRGKMIVESTQEKEMYKIMKQTKSFLGNVVFQLIQFGEYEIPEDGTIRIPGSPRTMREKDRHKLIELAIQTNYYKWSIDANQQIIISQINSVTGELIGDWTIDQLIDAYNERLINVTYQSQAKSKRVKKELFDAIIAVIEEIITSGQMADFRLALKKESQGRVTKKAILSAIEAVDGQTVNLIKYLTDDLETVIWILSDDYYPGEVSLSEDKMYIVIEIGANKLVSKTAIRKQGRITKKDYDAILQIIKEINDDIGLMAKFKSMIITQKQHRVTSTAILVAIEHIGGATQLLLQYVTSMPDELEAIFEDIFEIGEMVLKHEDNPDGSKTLIIETYFKSTQNKSTITRQPRVYKKADYDALQVILKEISDQGKLDVLKQALKNNAGAFGRIKTNSILAAAQQVGGQCIQLIKYITDSPEIAESILGEDDYGQISFGIDKDGQTVILIEARYMSKDPKGRNIKIQGQIRVKKLEQILSIINDLDENGLLTEIRIQIQNSTRAQSRVRRQIIEDAIQQIGGKANELLIYMKDEIGMSIIGAILEDDDYATFIMALAQIKPNEIDDYNLEDFSQDMFKNLQKHFKRNTQLVVVYEFINSLKQRPEIFYVIVNYSAFQCIGYSSWRELPFLSTFDQSNYEHILILKKLLELFVFLKIQELTGQHSILYDLCCDAYRESKKNLYFEIPCLPNDLNFEDTTDCLILHNMNWNIMHEIVRRQKWKKMHKAMGSHPYLAFIEDDYGNTAFSIMLNTASFSVIKILLDDYPEFIKNGFSNFQLLKPSKRNTTNTIKRNAFQYPPTLLNILYDLFLNKDQNQKQLFSILTVITDYLVSQANINVQQYLNEVPLKYCTSLFTIYIERLRKLSKRSDTLQTEYNTVISMIDWFQFNNYILQIQDLKIISMLPDQIFNQVDNRLEIKWLNQLESIRYLIKNRQFDKIIQLIDQMDKLFIDKFLPSDIYNIQTAIDYIIVSIHIYIEFNKLKKKLLKDAIAELLNKLCSWIKSHTFLLFEDFSQNKLANIFNWDNKFEVFRWDNLTKRERKSNQRFSKCVDLFTKFSIFKPLTDLDEKDFQDDQSLDEYVKLFIQLRINEQDVEWIPTNILIGMSAWIIKYYMFCSADKIDYNFLILLIKNQILYGMLEHKGLESINQNLKNKLPFFVLYIMECSFMHEYKEIIKNNMSFYYKFIKDCLNSDQVIGLFQKDNNNQVVYTSIQECLVKIHYTTRNDNFSCLCLEFIKQFDEVIQKNLVNHTDMQVNSVAIVGEFVSTLERLLKEQNIDKIYRKIAHSYGISNQTIIKYLQHKDFQIIEKSFIFGVDNQGMMIHNLSLTGKVDTLKLFIDRLFKYNTAQITSQELNNTLVTISKVGLKQLKGFKLFSEYIDQLNSSNISNESLIQIRPVTNTLHQILKSGKFPRQSNAPKLQIPQFPINLSQIRTPISQIDQLSEMSTNISLEFSEFQKKITQTKQKFSYDKLDSKVQTDLYLVDYLKQWRVSFLTQNCQSIFTKQMKFQEVSYSKILLQLLEFRLQRGIFNEAQDLQVGILKYAIFNRLIDFNQITLYKLNFTTEQYGIILYYILKQSIGANRHMKQIIVQDVEFYIRFFKNAIRQMDLNMSLKNMNELAMMDVDLIKYKGKGRYIPLIFRLIHDNIKKHRTGPFKQLSNEFIVNFSNFHAKQLLSSDYRKGLPQDQLVNKEFFNIQWTDVLNTAVQNEYVDQRIMEIATYFGVETLKGLDSSFRMKNIVLKTVDNDIHVIVQCHKWKEMHKAFGSHTYCAFIEDDYNNTSFSIMLNKAPFSVIKLVLDDQLEIIKYGFSNFQLLKPSKRNTTNTIKRNAFQYPPTLLNILYELFLNKDQNQTQLFNILTVITDYLVSQANINVQQYLNEVPLKYCASLFTIYVESLKKFNKRSDTQQIQMDTVKQMIDWFQSNKYILKIQDLKILSMLPEQIFNQIDNRLQIKWLNQIESIRYLLLNSQFDKIIQLIEQMNKYFIQKIVQSNIQNIQTAINYIIVSIHIYLEFSKLKKKFLKDAIADILNKLCSWIKSHTFLLFEDFSQNKLANIFNWDNKFEVFRWDNLTKRERKSSQRFSKCVDLFTKFSIFKPLTDLDEKDFQDDQSLDEYVKLFIQLRINEQDVEWIPTNILIGMSAWIIKYYMFCSADKIDYNFLILLVKNQILYGILEYKGLEQINQNLKNKLPFFIIYIMECCSMHEYKEIIKNNMSFYYKFIKDCLNSDQVNGLFQENNNNEIVYTSIQECLANIHYTTRNDDFSCLCLEFIKQFDQVIQKNKVNQKKIQINSVPIIGEFVSTLERLLKEQDIDKIYRKIARKYNVFSSVNSVALKKMGNLNDQQFEDNIIQQLLDGKEEYILQNVILNGRYTHLKILLSSQQILNSKILNVDKVSQYIFNILQLLDAQSFGDTRLVKQIKQIKDSQEYMQDFDCICSLFEPTQIIQQNNKSRNVNICQIPQFPIQLFDIRRPLSMIHQLTEMTSAIDDQIKNVYDLKTKSHQIVSLGKVDTLIQKDLAKISYLKEYRQSYLNQKFQSVFMTLNSTQVKRSYKETFTLLSTFYKQFATDKLRLDNKKLVETLSIGFLQNIYTIDQIITQINGNEDIFIGILNNLFDASIKDIRYQKHKMLEQNYNNLVQFVKSAIKSVNFVKSVDQFSNYLSIAKSLKKLSSDCYYKLCKTFIVQFDTLHGDRFTNEQDKQIYFDVIKCLISSSQVNKEILKVAAKYKIVPTPTDKMNQYLTEAKTRDIQVFLEKNNLVELIDRYQDRFLAVLKELFQNNNPTEELRQYLIISLWNNRTISGLIQSQSTKCYSYVIFEVMLKGIFEGNKTEFGLKLQEIYNMNSKKHVNTENDYNFVNLVYMATKFNFYEFYDTVVQFDLKIDPEDDLYGVPKSATERFKFMTPQQIESQIQVFNEFGFTQLAKALNLFQQFRELTNDQDFEAYFFYRLANPQSNLTLSQNQQLLSSMIRGEQIMIEQDKQIDFDVIQALTQSTLVNKEIISIVAKYTMNPIPTEYKMNQYLIEAVSRDVQKFLEKNNLVELIGRYQDRFLTVLKALFYKNKPTEEVQKYLLITLCNNKIISGLIQSQSTKCYSYVIFEVMLKGIFEGNKTEFGLKLQEIYNMNSKKYVNTENDQNLENLVYLATQLNCYEFYDTVVQFDLKIDPEDDLYGVPKSATERFKFMTPQQIESQIQVFNEFGFTQLAKALNLFQQFRELTNDQDFEAYFFYRLANPQSNLTLSQNQQLLSSMIRGEQIMIEQDKQIDFDVIQALTQSTLVNKEIISIVAKYTMNPIPTEYKMNQYLIEAVSRDVQKFLEKNNLVELIGRYQDRFLTVLKALFYKNKPTEEVQKYLLITLCNNKIISGFIQSQSTRCYSYMIFEVMLKGIFESNKTEFGLKLQEIYNINSQKYINIKDDENFENLVYLATKLNFYEFYDTVVQFNLKIHPEDDLYGFPKGATERFKFMTPQQIESQIQVFNEFGFIQLAKALKLFQQFTDFTTDQDFEAYFFYKLANPQSNQKLSQCQQLWSTLIESNQLYQDTNPVYFKASNNVFELKIYDFDQGVRFVQDEGQVAMQIQPLIPSIPFDAVFSSHPQLVIVMKFFEDKLLMNTISQVMLKQEGIKKQIAITVTDLEDIKNIRNDLNNKFEKELTHLFLLNYPHFFRTLKDQGQYNEWIICDLETSLIYFKAQLSVNSAEIKQHLNGYLQQLDNHMTMNSPDPQIGFIEKIRSCSNLIQYTVFLTLLNLALTDDNCFDAVQEALLTREIMESEKIELNLDQSLVNRLNQAGFQEPFDENFLIAQELKLKNYKETIIADLNTLKEILTEATRQIKYRSVIQTILNNLLKINHHYIQKPNFKSYKLLNNKYALAPLKQDSNFIEEVKYFYEQESQSIDIEDLTIKFFKNVLPHDIEDKWIQILHYVEFHQNLYQQLDKFQTLYYNDTVNYEPQGTRDAIFNYQIKISNNHEPIVWRQQQPLQTDEKLSQQRQKQYEHNLEYLDQLKDQNLIYVFKLTINLMPSDNVLSPFPKAILDDKYAEDIKKVYEDQNVELLIKNLKSYTENEYKHTNCTYDFSKFFSKLDSNKLLCLQFEDYRFKYSNNMILKIQKDKGDWDNSDLANFEYKQETLIQYFLCEDSKLSLNPKLERRSKMSTYNSMYIYQVKEPEHLAELGQKLIREEQSIPFSNYEPRSKSTVIGINLVRAEFYQLMELFKYKFIPDIVQEQQYFKQLDIVTQTKQTLVYMNQYVKLLSYIKDDLPLEGQEINVPWLILVDNNKLSKRQLGIEQHPLYQINYLFEAIQPSLVQKNDIKGSFVENIQQNTISVLHRIRYNTISVTELIILPTLQALQNTTKKKTSLQTAISLFKEWTTFERLVQFIIHCCQDDRYFPQDYRIKFKKYYVEVNKINEHECFRLKSSKLYGLDNIFRFGKTNFYVHKQTLFIRINIAQIAQQSEELLKPRTSHESDIAFNADYFTGSKDETAYLDSIFTMEDMIAQILKKKN